MSVTVTICIPTFRRLGYLKEAVAAAQAQTLQNIEVLISDDGVSEELKQWSESAARADSRVRYRRNTKNLGLGGNWNECVSAARGQWVVIQGDDDRLLPSFCESLLRIASSDSTVLFSNHYVIDEHGDRLAKESEEWTVRYRRHLLPRGKVQDAARCVWSNSVPMTAALVRADAIKRLGIKKWSHAVDEVVTQLCAALEADYVVIGGGNARKLKRLPKNARLGSNDFAFTGAFRVWRDGAKAPPAAKRYQRRIVIP